MSMHACECLCVYLHICGCAGTRRWWAGSARGSRSCSRLPCWAPGPGLSLPGPSCPSVEQGLGGGPGQLQGRSGEARLGEHRGWGSPAAVCSRNCTVSPRRGQIVLRPQMCQNSPQGGGERVLRRGAAGAGGGCVPLP
uniref:Uncharacterized protein DKFZp566H184 n=1 Tax=Homo sapiens TaxID=9606 RepID=Q5GMH4_HUMAN|nr:hypothetical protein [Homo sapiens]